tara:strand:- start:884 stop:1069 length:186 start_codon:yes stop_codon:yes gene_type:complete
MEEHVTTEQLLDLAAFIKKAAENPLIKNDDVLANVQHDVEGFVFKKHDEFWVPRTKGWNKH